MIKRLPALALLLPMFFLASCLKDTCTRTYTIFTPVYKTVSEIRKGMKSVAPRPLGSTGKIYTIGTYLLVGERGKGIHVIDNSNPASPKNLSFINIPGNEDLAVKGNFLYADSYSDIVVFNMSNPLNVSPVKFLDHVLEGRDGGWRGQTDPDSVKVIAEYIRKDTIMDCERFAILQNDVLFSTGGGVLANATVKSGKGGSMARFTIVNDFLYGVTDDFLYSINISTADQPQLVGTKQLGWGIETIYPFQDNLFIGSNTGMFLFSITDPANPVIQGSFSHARVCDPVIADGQYAYVTLRSGNMCQGNTNQLDILFVPGLGHPSLVKSYPMTNPRGLSKDGDLLFLCDGNEFRVYDATDPISLAVIKSFTVSEPFDVIAQDGLAILVAEKGIYQYAYGANGATQLLSFIPVSK